MNLSKDKLLTLVSDKLLQALKNQDRGEDGQLEDNLFTPSNQNSKAYMIQSILAEDETMMSKFEIANLNCELIRKDIGQNIDDQIDKIKQFNDKIVEEPKFYQAIAECENCENKDKINLMQTFVSRGNTRKLIIPKRIQNIYSSYHQDHYDHLNCVANNLYIENQNDCRVFNLLMDNGIIKLNYDGSLNVYVKSDISSDDLDNLVSLPISEVTYLTVSLKDCNQNIEVFLNNNKINYIRELAFVDAKFRSVDMSLCMDGFSKISRKVTGHIDLYSLKIEPKTFNQFFNELHQSYDLKSRLVSYNYDQSFYQENCASKYSFISIPSDCKKFYSLIDKRLIKPVGNNQIEIYLHLEKDAALLDFLASLPIPYVDYMKITTEGCDNLIRSFLYKNIIIEIKYLEFNDYNGVYEIGACIGGFMESAYSVTEGVILQSWIMNSNSFAQLFSGLNKEHSISVQLNDIRCVMKNPFTIPIESYSAVKALIVNLGYSIDKEAQLQFLLNSIGGTVISSSNFKLFYLKNPYKVLCCSKIIETIKKYNSKAETNIISECKC